MRAWILAIGSLLVLSMNASAIEGEIPAEFAAFEHLIGPWKGTAIPTANKLKGWPESHLWAWKFTKGIPVGMSVEFKGSKSIKSGSLTYDAKAKHYTLYATDQNDKPAVYQGNFDTGGKNLTLDRTTEVEGAKERIMIRLLPENTIRYTVWVDRKETGVPQYKRFIEVGLTKEGESFAAGGAATDLPKCIITGGASAMTVAYMGVSYPICCSGCRDEFTENPEKYVKKAALRAQAAPAAVKPATSSSAGKDDGEFGGLVEGAGAGKSKAMPKEKAKAKAEPGKSEEPSTPAKSETSKTQETEAKAAQLLKQAQTLEKTGKTTGAVANYKRIVKEFPDTPQAKTAAERIKALNP